MKRPVPDEVILGLLESHPAHGYDLLESFRSNEKLGRMWNLSTSQLYAVLKRLEDEGAIIGNRIQSPDGPARIVYSVTAKGSDRLTSWLFEKTPSASVHRIRVLFLSRLYVARLLEIKNEKIVEYQRNVCEKRLKNFLEDRNKLQTSFEKLTLDFIIGQLKSAITWLDNCEKELFKSSTENIDLFEKTTHKKFQRNTRIIEEK